MKITSVVVPKAKSEKSLRSSSHVVYCTSPINYVVFLVSHTKAAIYTNHGIDSGLFCVDISNFFTLVIIHSNC